MAARRSLCAAASAAALTSAGELSGRLGMPRMTEVIVHLPARVDDRSGRAQADEALVTGSTPARGQPNVWRTERVSNCARPDFQRAGRILDRHPPTLSNRRPGRTSFAR